MVHALAVLALTLSIAAGASVSGINSATAQGAFYNATPDEIAGKPGTIIRTETLFDAPEGAAAYRILYRSKGVKDEEIAVSGYLVIPANTAPPGGRPVVAWAHPTSGVVPKCAPSLAKSKYSSIQGLREMLHEGFVVVATDYPGLGTPGPHPYLVGNVEARSVIDSVRATRNLPQALASNRYAVWGHSQGGQAALFSGMLSAQYAPELKLVGIAAAAPATDLGTLLVDDFTTVGGKNLTAMTLWSWSRVFGAPIDKIVDPCAIPTIDRLANECIESLLDILEREATARPLQHAFLPIDELTRAEPWHSLIAENSPGRLPRDIPVFLSQGTADQTVRPDVTAKYMTRLCKAGSQVHMVIKKGDIHAFIARDTAREAVGWIEDRFAGLVPPSDCKTHSE
jgi:pimeloyl-ACP methyl ester carboxylesterase